MISKMLDVMENTSDTSKPSAIFSNETAYPLVLNFQNGNLADSATGNISGAIYTSSKEKTAAVVIDDMLYTGNEQKNNVCRNVIVARNKNTGVIRLIEVGSALLKAMPDELIQSSDAVDSVQEDLGAVFGSKRRKRALEQSKRLKIDIDTMKEQLEKTVTEKEIDDTEMVKPAEETDNAMDKYAPPINRYASNVKEVYKVHDFLSEDQINTLRVSAEDILGNKESEIVVSEYILDIINKLKSSAGSLSVDHCCLLLYADCIVRYLKEDYKKVCHSNYLICPYSELINNFVFESYSMRNEKGRSRPQTCKDKAVCYLIAMLLIINNYLIPDISKLSKAINITSPKIMLSAKVVGARVVTEGKVSAILLKLPLTKMPIAYMKRGTK